eukprot:TRINITY_DN1161_c0_g1_i2.p1 TRINITY_DN1161_c0_g1~~TRINITY_DN1161_c0_g1_i2.p1  ORF type:complete len:499 (-),score=47.30 TRINITY_DN1161_c0_g1_i2:326-1768(-)
MRLIQKVLTVIVLQLGVSVSGQGDLIVENPTNTKQQFATQQVSPKPEPEFEVQQSSIISDVADCSFIVAQYDMACAEVYRPVCGIEENLTYWNCCYVYYFGNSTTYMEGECEGDEPDFRNYDDVPLSDVTIEALPVLDGPVETGTRKLLQQYDYSGYMVLDIVPVPNASPSEPEPSSSESDTLLIVPTPEEVLEVNLTVVDGIEHLVVDSLEEVLNSRSPFGFESVIDTNDLRQIRNTSRSPFNSIGRFEHLGCTGFLIHDQMVLTSAYCVYDRRNQQFYNQETVEQQSTAFDFTPAQNGPEDTPLGSLRWHSAIAPGQYNVDISTASKQDVDYADQFDFALVLLKDSFVERCQEAGFTNCNLMTFASECLDRNYNLNVAGYRLEKELGPELTERLWVAPCFDQSINCNKPTFNHTCDTTTGMAGAPLWATRTGNPLKYIVRGIHSVGLAGVNKAVTLTQEYVDKINTWIEDGKRQLNLD